MRIAYLVLFFFSISCFAQNIALGIKIDSITSKDPTPNERKFTISYHIENRSEKPISFILKPDYITSNATSSMAYNPAYRLYQSDEIINTENVFNTKIIKEAIERLNKEMDYKITQSNNGPRIDVHYDLEKMKTARSQEILKSIVKLNPKEIRNFKTTLNWDKNRHSEYFGNEYYLDEKATHYFDLCINLFKEEFKEKLLPEDFKKLMENKTIIKGWVQSNKMEINFN